ncbi:hypothetical protein N1495_00500 [Streptococcus didelphis]|nr:hypothetical protein [Streptococcus didelphis]WMB29512.1 hypothetical protein N1495_09855 [Streptococcus didelphis]WMB29577.1 hypothetical protein N1495_00500 [Streptococcus didelphis]
MPVLMIDGQGYIQKSHFDAIKEYQMEQYRDLYAKTAIFVEDIVELLTSDKGKPEKINLYFKDGDKRDYYFTMLNNYPF